MTEHFNQSLDFVLKWEGGYENDPDDPGGETKYGISKRYNPDVDIKNLTEEQAGKIYRLKYWEPAGCGEEPWPFCLLMFDTAVNLGVGRAKEFKTVSGGRWERFVALRLQYYSKKVKSKPVRLKYLRGWLNRVIDLIFIATQ